MKSSLILLKAAYVDHCWRIAETEMNLARHDKHKYGAENFVQETNPLVPDTGDINKEQMSKSNILDFTITESEY